MVRILTANSPVPEWLEKVTFDQGAINPHVRVGCLSVVYQRGGSYHWRPVFGSGPLMVIHAKGDVTVNIQGMSPPGASGGVYMHLTPVLEPGLLLLCGLLAFYLAS